MKIAIDGPAGSGKSTVAKMLSQALNLPYLDTGALYRAFGYVAMLKGVDSNNQEQVLSLFEEDIKVELDIGKTRVFYCGKVLEDEIRNEQVGNYTSKIAAIPAFRERMIELFRKLVGSNQVVAEGRDVGSHIFPDAPKKFFLTASLEERAKRRYNELKAKGLDTSYEDTLETIKQRDERDKNRPLYPFEPARDAIVIDTTDKNPQEVLNLILEMLK